MKQQREAPNHGTWITELEYAAIYNLGRSTLARWRMEDRRAGRTGAPPDYPFYKKFGNAVRYRLETDDAPIHPAVSARG